VQAVARGDVVAKVDMVIHTLAGETVHAAGTARLAEIQREMKERSERTRERRAAVGAPTKPQIWPVFRPVSGVLLELLKLPRREPRCMACGGNLAEVPKEEIRDEVPARTFAWLDTF
jgi:hypothetical protein